MEPIRLWRVNIGHGELGWWFDPPSGESTEYAALPRADYDALEARLARAEKERDEAREALCGIKSLHAEDGRVDAKFAGEFVKAFSAGFVQMYRDSGAKNYLDIKFIDRTTGEGYTVTVQRDLGKTAHALRTEAEASLDAALKQRDEARGLLRDARHWVASEAAYPDLATRIDRCLEDKA